VDTIFRILEITHKEFLELWRKAGIIAFVLAIPVVEMIVMGYATAGNIDDLPVAVYDADRTAASRRFIETLHYGQGFEVTHLVSNVPQAERKLEEGDISAFFLIPAGFEAMLATTTEEAVLAAVIDGSNTAVANYATIYADEMINYFATRHLEGVDRQKAPIRVEPHVWYNQDIRRENFYIPGLLGTMLSLVVLAITAVSIVRERERGTLEQLMVSPIRPLELIIGKLLPIIVIAYAELGLMLVIATQIFQVTVRGSLTLYIGLMFIYLLAEMGIGILISILSTTQAQALPTIFLMVTINAILAGFITPVDTMPLVAQAASALVPLSYFITITRDLFAKGAGFQTLVPQLLPLITMSLVLFTASVLALRRRLV
jgi:ABC-2 type transport system permease protein